MTARNIVILGFLGGPDEAKEWRPSIHLETARGRIGQIKMSADNYHMLEELGSRSLILMGINLQASLLTQHSQAAPSASCTEPSTNAPVKP